MSKCDRNWVQNQMNESSRKATISRGIMKRKGIRIGGRVCTRNRSKVEKIRESLKHLKIEEKQIKLTKTKLSRGDPRSRDWFHDCDLDIRIGDHELSVQLHNLQFPLEDSLKRHSCLKRRVENSPVNSESLNHGRSERLKAKCGSSGSRPGVSGRIGKSRDQLEKRYSDWNGDSQTSKSDFSMSETVGFNENTMKSDSDKDQRPLSPPNSPLYDMPPPSTPAQKRERRAKRLLQLERWKKCETSRSRQERYQRRAQDREAETMQKSVSMDSRRVQWSYDLVQTVYINDPDDEPNRMDLPMV